jgi:hypothetical protein
MFPIHVNFGVMRRSCAVALVSAALLAASGAVPAAESKQKTFASPEEAAKALVTAVKAADKKAMLEILGTGAKALVESGDAVADKQAGERFAKAYDEANKLEKSGDAKAVLSVGKDGWPFPIPLVKGDKGWSFDTKAGKEEVLNRRIGRNELSVIQVLQAYVDAQREYYLRNPQGDKLLHYAQKFESSPGKKDGLYFPVKAGEMQSPLGPLVTGAKAEGYGKNEKSSKRAPYHGYRFRILKAQGPDAPGGAYSYVANGQMIGGHAVIAWPDQYGNSGVMTFMINQDGVVYQKDLGPQTATAAQKITTFNPDKTWKKEEAKTTAKK